MNKILIKLILIMLIPHDAFAISKEPQPKLCNTLFFADIAIHAKVLKHEEIFSPEDPSSAPDDKYYLNIIKTYRGGQLNSLVVTSEMGTLNVKLDAGKEYILFPSLLPNGNWEIFDSQGEAEGGIAFSKAAEQKIENILSKKISSIEGEVRDKNWNLVSNIKLKIIGNGQIHSLTTEKDGGFFLKLSPGTYKIKSPENLSVSIYSPDGEPSDKNDHQIEPQTLVNGQCSQIQLQVQ